MQHPEQETGMQEPNIIINGRDKMEFSEFERKPETKFVSCRDTLISLIKEEPVSPAGNAFMIKMATVCFVFFVLALIFMSRC